MRLHSSANNGYLSGSAYQIVHGGTCLQKCCKVAGSQILHNDDEYIAGQLLYVHHVRTLSPTVLEKWLAGSRKAVRGESPKIGILDLVMRWERRSRR